MSLLCVITFGNLSANAQEQDFFVRVGAGANYYWGEDDSNLRLLPHISPSASLIAGKWFNPYWGVQLGCNFGKIYGAGVGETPYSNGEKVKHSIHIKGCLQEKFNFFTVQPEIVYNVSNGICGYNPERVWNVLVHLGPSYGHSWANGQSANSVFATGGLTSTWRLARNLQLWADARLTVFGKDFDKVTYRDDIDCMGTISAGISINFGKQD